MAQTITQPPLVSRNCPICPGAATSRPYAQANIDTRKLNNFAYSSRKTPEYMHYRLEECTQCDLIYAADIPSTNYLGQAYLEADFASSLEAHYASRTYQTVVAKLQTKLPDKIGALDIGAGDGCFLEKLLELGFSHVQGVEPSTAPIRAAKTEIRPLIKHSLFKAQDYPQESYSLITCFQTIEHVDDPLELARSAAKLLKPQGALLIICHNRRSLVNTLLGAKSPIRDIEHLQLFSPQSARRLMEQAGYINIQVRPIVNRYPLDYWFRLVPLSQGTKSKLTAIATRLGIIQLPLPMPVSNLAVLGYKP